MDPLSNFLSAIDKTNENIKDDDIGLAFNTFHDGFSHLLKLNGASRLDQFPVVTKCLRKMVVLAKKVKKTEVEELYNYSQSFSEVAPRLFLMTVVAIAAIHKNVEKFETIIEDLDEMSTGVRDADLGIFLRHFFVRSLKPHIYEALNIPSSTKKTESAVQSPKNPEKNSETVSLDNHHEPTDIKDLKSMYVRFLIKYFIEMNKLWVLQPKNAQYIANYMSDVFLPSPTQRKSSLELINYPLNLISRLSLDSDMYKNIVYDQLVLQIIHCNEPEAQANILDIMLKMAPAEFNIETIEDLFELMQNVKTLSSFKTLTKSLFVNLTEMLNKLYSSEPIQLKARMEQIFDLVGKCSFKNEITNLFFNNCYVEMVRRLFPTDLQQMDKYLQAVSASLAKFEIRDSQPIEQQVQNCDEIVSPGGTAIAFQSSAIFHEIEQFLQSLLKTKEDLIQLIVLDGFTGLFNAIPQKDSFIKHIAQDLIQSGSHTCSYKNFETLTKIYIVPFLKEQKNIRGSVKSGDRIPFEDRIQLACSLFSCIECDEKEQRFESIKLAVDTLKSLNNIFSYKAIISNLLFSLISVLGKDDSHGSLATGQVVVQESDPVLVKKIATYVLKKLSEISTPELATDSVNLLMSMCSRVDKLAAFDEQQEMLNDIYSQILATYEEDILDNKSQIEYLEIIIDHLQTIKTLSVDSQISFQTKCIQLSMRLLKKADQCNLLIKVCHILLPNMVENSSGQAKQFTISEVLNKALKIANTIIEDEVKVDTLVKILKSFVEFSSSGTQEPEKIKRLLESIDNTARELISDRAQSVTEQVDTIRKQIQESNSTLWAAIQ